LQGGHGFFIGDFDEMENNGLIRAEHRAGGDAEQEGITNLTGSAGNRDSDGGCIHSFKMRGEVCVARGKRASGDLEGLGVEELKGQRVGKSPFALNS
jgi:hypothetical protein